MRINDHNMYIPERNQKKQNIWKGKKIATSISIFLMWINAFAFFTLELLTSLT